jgi:hypothetical protein
LIKSIETVSPHGFAALDHESAVRNPRDSGTIAHTTAAV